MPELTIDREYSTPTLDWPVIIAAAQGQLLPLIGEIPEFDARVSKAGETLRFASLTEMEGTEIIGSDIRLAWYDRDWQTDLRIRRYDDEAADSFELSLKLDQDRRSEALAALSAFEAELGVRMVDRETALASYDDLLELSYEYYNDAFDPQAAYRHMADLLSETQTDTAPQIEISQRSGTGGEHRARIEPAELPNSTDALETLTLRLCSRTSKLREFELAFRAGQYDRTYMTMRLMPEMAEIGKKMIQSLSQALSLTRYRDAEPTAALHGLGRIHFAVPGSEIDLAWFARFTAQLRRFVARPSYKHARVASAERPQREITFTSLADLEAHLAEIWPHTWSIDVTIEQPGLHFQATIEPQLDWVHLSVRAISAAAAEEILNDMAGKLDLRAVEKNPYTRPITQKTYAIRHLDRAAFAVTVRDIIGPGPRAPQLQNSFVSEREAGGELQNTYFTSLDEILDRVGYGPSFAELRIEVQKPKGEAISFAIDAAHRTLEVKSSFEAERFADLKKTLRRRLSLAETSESDSKGQRKGFLSRTFDPDTIKGRVIILAFAGITGLVGLFADRLFPEKSVALTVPRGLGEASAAVTAGCIEVTWVLRQDAWFSEGDQRIDAKGTVMLTRTDATSSLRVEGHQSGTQLHIPPGSWDVAVFDPRLRRASDPVRVDAADYGYGARLSEIEQSCGAPGGE